MISAFGLAAERFAARLPPNIEAVIADLSTLGPAYRAAVERRTTGQSFFTALLVGDPRTDITRAVARTFVEDPTWDNRRQQLDLLDRGAYVVNGKPAAETWILADDARRASLGFIGLGDALLVRSVAEYERLSALTGRRRMNFAVVANSPNDFSAAIVPVERRKVIIWAPHLPADAIAHIVLSLEEYRLPVTAIVERGILPHVRTEFVTYDERAARAYLARAACIVDAEVVDAGNAQALAHLCPTVPLAVASTSGAHEFIDNVSSYLPWSRASVYAAVCGALGAGAPRPRRLCAVDEHELQEVLRATAPELNNGPLASIVIPTFNRRSVLAHAIRCIEKQTYQNVECIVVNDAGEDVSDIVDQFPRARLLSLSENIGGIRALNAGIRMSRGAYVGALADDDALYPDHVARHVSALERSRLNVSSSNILVRHLRKMPNDTLELSAFNAETFSYTVDPTEVLCSSPIAGQAMLIRRSFLEEIGESAMYAEDTALADQELQLRLMSCTNFAHVDRFTGEWTIREDPGWHFAHRVQKDVPDDLRRVFAKHPVVARPFVDALRTQIIANVAARPPNAVFAPTIAFNPA